jgi:hypothetical protein
LNALVFENSELVGLSIKLSCGTKVLILKYAAREIIRRAIIFLYMMFELKD